MVDRDLIRECREYVAANEESAREYLSRYFAIKEFTLSKLETTMISEFMYMLVEDLEKTPGIKYSKTTYLDPAQSPEAIVHMKWLEIPEHLSDLRCYRITPKMFVTKPNICKEIPEKLKTEELTMAILPFFHLSSFLAFLHRQCPYTEKAIEEYEKSKSLKELQNLVSSS